MFDRRREVRRWRQVQPRFGKPPIGPVVCRGSNCSQLVPAEFLLLLPDLVCTYTENTERQARIRDTCDEAESRADYAFRSSFLSRPHNCRN